MRQNLCYAFAGLIAVSAIGCYSPGENTFPSTERAQRRMRATRQHAHRHLADMVDNGMLHDMAIVDEHFVPHTSELNGTGAARLERMAVLLNSYGGTVRYDSRSADAEMIADRIAHIREYLEVSGCDMSRVRVESMMSGGYGVRAVRAIENDDTGTAATEQTTPSSSSSSSSLSPTLSSPSGN